MYVVLSFDPFLCALMRLNAPYLLYLSVCVCVSVHVYVYLYTACSYHIIQYMYCTVGVGVGVGVQYHHLPRRTNEMPFIVKLTIIL